MKRDLIALLALLVLLGACEIKEFSLPDWEVQLSVPLINEKFYVSDLVDSVNIVVDENQVLTLTGNGEVTSEIFGNLSFSPQSTLSDQSILSGAALTLDIPFYDTAGCLTIAYAQIASGNFRYSFSDVHSTAEVTIKFLNLFDANNQPMVLSSTAGSGWKNLNLNGMHIGIPNSNTTIPGLQMQILSTSSLPEGTPIAQFSFEAHTPLLFSLFRGYMNDMHINLLESSSSITIDYPHDVDESVSLRQASLKLEVENEIGFGAEFHGRLFAHNEDGDTLSIPIVDDNGQSFHVNAATAGVPVTTTLETVAGIEPILQMMPDSLQIVNGFFTFNSGNIIGEVSSSDIVTVDYTVNAPFHFDLHEHEVIIDSLYSIEISEENQENILEKAQAADLTIELLNKLPIGASAKVFFGNSELLDASNPATYSFAKQATVLAATDPNPWQSVNISLSKEELDVFAHPTVYYTWSFSFQELPDVTIYARTSDYLHVRCMVNAKIKMEDVK